MTKEMALYKNGGRAAPSVLSSKRMFQLSVCQSLSLYPHHSCWAPSCLCIWPFVGVTKWKCGAMVTECLRLWLISSSRTTKLSKALNHVGSRGNVAWLTTFLTSRFEEIISLCSNVLWNVTNKCFKNELCGLVCPFYITKKDHILLQFGFTYNFTKRLKTRLGAVHNKERNVLQCKRTLLYTQPHNTTRSLGILHFQDTLLCFIYFCKEFLKGRKCVIT